MQVYNHTRQCFAYPSMYAYVGVRVSTCVYHWFRSLFVVLPQRENYAAIAISTQTIRQFDISFCVNEHIWIESVKKELRPA